MVFVGELPVWDGSGPDRQPRANVVSIREAIDAGTAGPVNDIPVLVSTSAAGRTVSAVSLGDTVSARDPLALRAPPADSALFLQVDLPGGRAAALVGLGLASDGMTADHPGFVAGG